MGRQTMADTRNLYRQIASLHIANLDQSFLASLGPQFLSEVYRAMDKSDAGYLLYEYVDEKIVGFVTGGQSMGPIYRAMFPRILYWGFPLAFHLLSFSRLKRVADIIRYSQGENDALPMTELFSIAVAPSARGTGVAANLYNRLLQAFQADGIKNFRIVVGQSLAPAHKFYLKMGADVKAEIELHSGEKSLIYVHDIVSSQ